MVRKVTGRIEDRMQLRHHQRAPTTRAKDELAYSVPSNAEISPLTMSLMLEFHRYHYAQILLCRPAISFLLKLQAHPASLGAPDNQDQDFKGSFALNSLRQFAWKCLEAAVYTVDLLRAYQESGREIMIPERNFTPFCFCAYDTLF